MTSIHMISFFSPNLLKFHLKSVSVLLANSDDKPFC